MTIRIQEQPARLRIAAPMPAAALLAVLVACSARAADLLKSSTPSCVRTAAVVIDCSGSFEPWRDAAITAAQGLVGRLSAGDCLCVRVVGASSFRESDFPLLYLPKSTRPIDPANDMENRRRKVVFQGLLERLRQARSSRMTDIWGAIQAASEVLGGLGASERILIVYSDMKDTMRKIDAGSEPDLRNVAVNVFFVAREGDPREFGGRLGAWKAKLGKLGAKSVAFRDTNMLPVEVGR